jgi:ABC-type sugar transport system permease subunit
MPWLIDVRWSKPSIALLVLWRWTGYNMVLMLAGLQGIEPEYYEAAAVDGASKLRQMWHVTLPLMRPTIFFCLILSLIGTVYMFDETVRPDQRRAGRRRRPTSACTCSKSRSAISGSATHRASRTRSRSAC